MNLAVVFYMLGWVLLCEGALMLLPALVSILCRDGSLSSILIAAGICLVVGGLLILRKPKKWNLRVRESMAVTALGWIGISLLGALPFWISGAIPNPIDALFETVSGFTTTGASILRDVEVIPRGLLFWRSFTHWIGGMGVLVFLLTLMPRVGASQVNLMKAESPGPQVEKLVPKTRTTAMILYGLYIGITVLEIVFLLFGGLSLFDASALSFGTVGTGGFGVRNDSIASYSTYVQVVINVFMILCGVNFNFYFLLILRKFRRAFAIDEVRWYLTVFVSASLIIAFNARHLFASFGAALQQACFQVGSVMTTTGYATADFDAWPQLARSILLVLMFIGACAGSTGGGFKMARVVILVKTFFKECRQLLHPQSVVIIHMDNKPVPHNVVRSADVFLVTYVVIGLGSFLLLSFNNFDFTTTFTAVTAALNNIGPGLGGVGPTQTYAGFSAFSKIVLIFDMLAGRLELFPVLLLFSRHTWKKY